MKKKEKIKPKSIVISHSYADFDAIASTIAVSKLYPEVIPVLNYSCEEEVQRFLSIYKDYIRLTPIHLVSFELVEQVIVTDFQDISRIKPLMAERQKRPIKIMIYDHHPAEEPLKGTSRIIKPYGSTTTILYEKLKRNKASFSAIEATLFLIGIYEDTGSLSFSSTTVKDMEAAAFFLKNGAKLNIISDFVFPPISEAQKVLYTQLFSSLQIIEIKGVQIGICTVESRKYVEGVSFLAHRILESTNADVLILLVKFNHDILIVGRSRDKKILQIHCLMEYYGGGGHPQAGSAFLKENNMNLNLLSTNILRNIKKEIRISRQVKDFMTTPVKVVSPLASAEETLKIMLRYGHSGLPVIDKEKIVGIISRRDIERINEEKLRMRPVKYYMSKSPVIIRPESSMKEAENLMIHRDIGRLPVVSEGRLMGILTRSDLLRALYGIQNDQRIEQMIAKRPPDALEVKLLLEKNISSYQLNVIKGIASLANKMLYPLYLVGGCVRDLLLGLPSQDIDLLVDGNAIELARNFNKRNPHFKAIYNQKFGTAKIWMNKDTVIDLASARTEYYEHPADLPHVSSGSLREDLFRRDFTINTLAINLNQDNYGKLINHYRGYEDLQAKKIKVLHNLSFIEDPSRIFRAVTYLLKFGFTWDHKTKELATNAMGSGIFERTSRFRIMSELISLLKENIPIAKAIQKLHEIDAIPMLSSNITVQKSLLQSIQKAEKITRILETEESWVIYLLLLTLSVPQEEMADIMERLKLNYRKKLWITHFRENYSVLESSLESLKSYSNSDIFFLLCPFQEEELIALSCLVQTRYRNLIKRYLMEWKKIKLESTGHEIKEWTGLNGKPLGKLISKLTTLKIDGKIKNKEQEKYYAMSAVKKGEYKNEVKNSL